MSKRTRLRFALAASSTVRAVRFSAVAGVIALLFTAVAAGAGNQAKAAKPVLRYGVADGWNNPNPALDPSNRPFRALAYEQIIHMAPNGTFVPGLATSWRYFPTGTGPNKGFEFTLRHNARFSDGTLVTAPRVVAWFKYFLAAKGGYSASLGPNPSFKSVGQWTVQIRMRAPNPSVPFQLSEREWGYVSSPQAIAKPTLFATGSYGAGPYMLDGSRTVQGDHYTFVPNPHYYNPSAIKWREVDVKVIPTDSSMLAALQSGQLDASEGTPKTAAAAQAAGFNVVSALQGVDRLIVIGRDAPPLNDIRVRQALNYAINRKAIAQAVLGKYGAPISETITSDGFDPKYQNYYSYDPKKAKALLAAAGYPHGFTVKAIDQTFVLPTGDVLVRPAAQDLSAVGVNLDIYTANTGADYAPKILSGEYPLGEHPPGIIPMSDHYGFFLSPNGILNPRHVDDPVIDKLYQRGLRARNASVYWKQISDRMTVQGYFINIASYDAVYFVSKKIGGVASGPQRQGFVYPEEWYPK
jgi:peptide/nickel transport system substrate-binding protein